MQIVDAQIHVWGSGLPSNLAHRQVTAFTTEEAVGLMDEGGVDAAVIHPPGWDPGATAMAFAAVRDYPGRFAIMGAFAAGPAGEPRAGGDLEEPAGHARSALRVPAGAAARLVGGWHARLALGRRRACRRPDRDAGDGLACPPSGGSPSATPACG